MNVTKDVNSKMVGGAIHNSLVTVFDKFEKGVGLEEGDLVDMSIQDIYNDPRYESMTKKDKLRMKSWIRSFDKSFLAETVSDVIDNQAYFICKFCDNYRKIPPSTLIYSQSYLSDQSSNDVSDIETDDQTLARTRAYVCPEESCKTNTDNVKREAVLTRNGAGQVVYICTVCGVQWTQSM